MCRDPKAPELEERVFDIVSKMNEAERFDYLFKEGLRYAGKNPYRYLKPRALSAFYFWFTHYQWGTFPESPPNPLAKWVTVFFVVSAFMGTGTAFARYPQSRLLLIFCLSYFLLYSMTHADVGDRYRLVLDPYLLMFASLFLWRVFSFLPRFIHE